MIRLIIWMIIIGFITGAGFSFTSGVLKDNKDELKSIVDSAKEILGVNISSSDSTPVISNKKKTNPIIFGCEDGKSTIILKGKIFYIAEKEPNWDDLVPVKCE